MPARRHAALALSGVAALACAAACRSPEGSSDGGQLSFKAHAPAGRVTHGVSPLGLARERDGFLFVPRGNGAGHPQPLVVLLHGATQRAGVFENLVSIADTLGVVILAPDSRGVTWDAVRGDFGPDVEFLDRAIMRALDRAHIDACRVVIGGFSDGASYALSLGIRNARRLGGVVAFSPGFVVPAQQVDKLPVFMRHGIRDAILPIDRSARPLLAALKNAGFNVDYAEFDGPHTVRSVDVRASMQWASARTCATG